jgi:biotin carboxyl carrier protein
VSDSIRISGKKIGVPSRSSMNWKLEQRPGGWVVAVSDQGVRKRVFFHERRGQISGSLHGVLFSGAWIHETREVKGGGTKENVSAQFPGKVRKILVQKGATVAEGDGLVLMEAMKMEFLIKAPFAGKIRSLRVTEGQQVSPGDFFVDWEDSPSG